LKRNTTTKALRSLAKNLTVICLVTDISEQEWLQSVAMNPVFDFLADADEDIYSLADGNSLK